MRTKKILFLILSLVFIGSASAIQVGAISGNGQGALAVFNNFFKQAYAVMEAIQYCAVVAGVVGVGFTLMANPNERILNMSVKTLAAGTILTLSFQQIPSWFGLLF